MLKFEKNSVAKRLIKKCIQFTTVSIILADLYLSVNRVNIKSRTSEYKHMWHWFPFLPMTETKLKPLEQVNKEGKRALECPQWYRHSNYSGFGLSVPVHYSVSQSLQRCNWQLYQPQVKHLTCKGKAIPAKTLSVQGGWGSQISRQMAHEGGKVVGPMHQPPSPPPKEIFLVLISVTGSTDVGP